MEELQARHRKEQKELQGKITSKKKNATKKTRKGVNDECDRLERELKERQHAECAALAPSSLEGDTSRLNLSDTDEHVKDDSLEVPLSDGTQDGSTSVPLDTAQTEGDMPVQTKNKKPNRQKARLARRAAEQAAQAEEAALEAANMPDQRQQELAAMKEQMVRRDLVETLIRPDGHCLYSACARNLSSDVVKDFKAVRAAAADYMTTHADDFGPFMEEPIQTYTHKVKDTAEWGGHLELQAISKAFSVNIQVLQANGHVEQISSGEPSEKTIWLAYYKHSFGLGEHYNALEQKPAG